MKSIIFIILLFFTAAFGFGQRTYQELIQDNSVNFYEACAAAEAYFESVDKYAKGSGWKEYQRWRYANESKYYPSGDRSSVDPLFVKKEFESFLLNNPSAGDRALYTDGWKELGPISIDSITGHYSPGLGRIESFYVNPDDMDIMYLGSRSGGFWKTADAGLTWTGTTDFLVAGGVNTIAVSPTNSDSVLINIRNSYNGTTHGIYRSTDGGDTWVETAYNPVALGEGGLGSNFGINSIAYHPLVPNLIFIATTDGLYRSADNLTSWLHVNEGSISDIEFHPTNSNIIYIYDYETEGPNKNKVLRSTDNGMSFSGSAEIEGNEDITLVQLDVTPQCEDCIYFASFHGIWKSTDSGLTFDFISNPIGGSEGFAVSDLDSSIMTCGYVDCLTSTNGGISFDQVTWWELGDAPFDGNQYIHADLREAECINGIFYVSTDGYLAKSEDNGVTWQRISDGIGIRENYTFGVSQSNHYRTMVGSQDNGTSIKLDDGWIEFAGADGMEAIIHPLNSDWMISSYQNGYRRRTLDAGQTQTDVTPFFMDFAAWVAPLVYDPNNPMTVYHFADDMRKSTDFAGYWKTIDLGFIGVVKEAAIAENNSNIIVYSTDFTIKRSTNGGATFVDIKGTLPDNLITDIAFDPKRDSTFIVTYNRYEADESKVFITHDLGNTWINITANLGNMPIQGAVIDHSDSSNIYLAGEIGVYTKTMGAEVWELYNENLPNITVSELEIVYGSNTLRAATWGRGVWEYTLKDRANYPAILITEITDPPTMETPLQDVDQYVTSKIHYDGELSSVYLKWSIDEPLFDNTIIMENVTDTTWVSTTAIPNYPGGTKVYFKVYAVGEDGDTTETYKFMYTVRFYCAAEGVFDTFPNHHIDYVDLEEISNTSGQNFYGDFKDLIANLYIDSTYTLQVNLAATIDMFDVVGAWIDFNYNGIFEGEEFIEMSDFDDLDQSFGTFTIPGYAVLNEELGMRIRNSTPGSLNPCGVFFGEVEDYSVIIHCAGDNALIDVSTCDAYVSPSGLYTWSESGIYSDTLLNELGCDSIITIDLTVNELDISVSVTDYALVANMVGATYHWLDCNDDWNEIAGETNQLLEPTENGSYAVILAKDGCSDTSACYDITALSFKSIDGTAMRLYPNPSDGKFIIDMEQYYSTTEIQVYDPSGRLVYNATYKDKSKIEIDLNVSIGIYFVTIENESHQKQRIKVIVE